MTREELDDALSAAKVAYGRMMVAVVTGGDVATIEEDYLSKREAATVALDRFESERVRRSA